MPALQDPGQPPPSLSWLPRSLAPFRYPMYQAIWGATLLSNLGVWVQSVGAAWLMTTIAPSADMVALVQTATAAPVLLFSLFGGTLADLWDRRKVFLTGQLIVFTGAVTLAVMQGVGAVTPWLLLALTFLLDTGSALRQPAYQSSVSELVPREELVNAISLNSIAFNLARASGPALGGVIVAGWGVQGAFLFNAASNIVILIVLMMWRRPKPVSDLPREPILQAMVGGLRYVRGSPPILAAMLRCASFTACAGSVWALLPLIARQDLGGGAEHYGLLLGCLGIGAVAGALTIGPLRQRVSGEYLIAGGTLAFTIPCLAIGMWPRQEVAIPALLIGGAAWMTTLSSFNVMVQLSAAGWVKARALAIYSMALFAGLALGSWGWGHAATLIGTHTALIVAGCALLATLTMAPFLRLPSDLNRDLSPMPGVVRPVLAPGVRPGDGAVAVTVSYRIDPERAAHFLKAIRPLRRLRLRDGALRWTIYQDSSDPGRWIEAYILASWLDDLRHQQRMTVADREVIERVNGFHLESELPKTTHLIARGSRRLI